MAQTDSAAIAAAIRFTVQKGVLANLRSRTSSMPTPSIAEEGRFDAGSDMLTFIHVPDLAVSDHDRQGPVGRRCEHGEALTINTVTVSTRPVHDDREHDGRG